MLPTTVIARENTGISAGADVRHSCCTFATMVCAKNQWLWMCPGGVQKLNWNLIRLSRRFKIECVYTRILSILRLRRGSELNFQTLLLISEPAL